MNEEERKKAVAAMVKAGNNKLDDNKTMGLDAKVALKNKGYSHGKE